MIRVASLIGVGLTILSAMVARGQQQPEALKQSRPQWIWADGAREDVSHIRFSKSFELPANTANAKLLLLTEYCQSTMRINGVKVGHVGSYDEPLERDCLAALRPGSNELEIDAIAGEGPSAVAFRLVMQTRNATHHVVTNATWKCGTATTAVLGEVAARPWLISPRAIEINPLDDYTQWKRALGEAAEREPGKFQALPGFDLRLIRSAAPEEGSWVSLAIDPQGRFVIAREDKGLLRMTLHEEGDRVANVETINDELLECRGLLFAHDALYANANNSKGLYRLRDIDGDDTFESVDLLYASTGGVGHGRNDLALGPDGWIYSIHGDSVDMPTTLTDLTSPFREQRRGASSREGHVLRLNEDGSKIELAAAGLRNPFGIDFNADGEMFTYDADAEHDMGAPWYRPTRVNQLVPGGDYGWRGVTGNWPPYYPDHPDNAPPTLDIGKGSPTAVKFGYQSQFPPAYQRALYILDWAYGRVLAVHFAPRGAGYFGRAEPFLRGRPLNVTDLDFGPDGAMYLVTGGRKTQSALYQVRFTGTRQIQTRQSTTMAVQQRARARFTSNARSTRRRLEALLTSGDSDVVQRAWPMLGSADPHVVHAARMAIERQPLAAWKALAIDESNPRIAVFALLSLARNGGKGTDAAILARLNEFKLGGLSRRELQAAAYTYQLCLTSDAEITDEQQRIAISQLEAVYPNADFDTNRILGEVLVSLGSPDVVRKTLATLATSARQADQMQCLHVLRNARRGWDAQKRKAYFSALRQSDDYLGGQGMPGFIQAIRQDAVATLSDAEKRDLGSLVESLPERDPPEQGPPRPFVRKWKLADLASDVDVDEQSRDLARGAQLFHAALCTRCHRMGTQGRSVGPELTSVAQRFSPRDLLREILEPSSTIAENYGRQRITTYSGKVYEGQVIFSGDYRSPVLRMATDPLTPAKLTEVLKEDIASSELAAQSFMPAGLLDTLEKDEVLDLLAYLRSGGRRQIPVDVE